MYIVGIVALAVAACGVACAVMLDNGLVQFEQETLARVMEARARVATARESGSVRSLRQAEGWLRATPALFRWPRAGIRSGPFRSSAGTRG